MDTSYTEPKKLLSCLIAALMALALFSGAPAATAGICTAPDDGTGTAQVPPEVPTAMCPTGHVSLVPFEIIDGLPPGDTIEIQVELVEMTLVSAGPGGLLGGQQETFTATARLEMQGTGGLTGFNRTILMPVPGPTSHLPGAISDSGPRTPGDPVQTFPTDMFDLEGSIFGDPDFDQLILTAGTGIGLPSPGQTTLTNLGDGTFNVDSFFDISYVIEFQGAPGSILDGMVGATSGNAGIQLGEAPAPEPVPAATPLALGVLVLLLLSSLTWLVLRRSVS